MSRILSALSFLNLLDSEGRLSMTNIALAVCVGKLAMSRELGGADVCALITIMLNYGHKRMVISKSPSQKDSE